MGQTIFRGAFSIPVSSFLAQRSNFLSQVLFDLAPNYRHAIQAGKDARHLWFALQEWRGDEPEGYFGDLGTWAEMRIKELGVE